MTDRDRAILEAFNRANVPDFNIQPRREVRQTTQAQRARHAPAPAAPAPPAPPAPPEQVDPEEGEIEAGPIQHNLFRDETVINPDSDSPYEVVVRRKQFQRQIKFRLDDALFSVKIRKKKSSYLKETPELLTLLEPLQEGLTAIIEELQNEYTANSHQIYLTVIEKGIDNGLNTGNFSLKTAPEIIAYSATDSLYYFLQVSIYLLILICKILTS
jgi:hypothetical protein